MKVGDLFRVERGNCVGIESQDKGTIAFVSAGTINTGVVGFVAPIARGRLFGNEPCISVAADGDGGMAYASPKFCVFYAATTVAILTPKLSHDFWATDLHGKLFAVSAYIRKQRWRFGFGRKLAPRVADLDLDMPAILSIVGKIQQTKPKARTLTPSDISALLAKIPAGIEIGQLFDEISRKNLTGEDGKDIGSVPLVSASECNNGVAGFVDMPSLDCLHPGGTLSVAKNGKPMVARVHMNEYVKTGDVASILPKGDVVYTDRELAILAALIESQVWRFSYGRKAGWARMKSQVIN